MTVRLESNQLKGFLVLDTLSNHETVRSTERSLEALPTMYSRGAQEARGEMKASIEMALSTTDQTV